MELEYKDNSRRGKVIIVLGVILALVAGGSAFMLVTNAQQQAGQQGLEKVPVVVARQPIAARKIIEEADVVVREVPLDPTNARGVTTSLDQVIGRVPAVTILEGQLVTTNLLASTASGGQFSILGPEETVGPESEAWRAVSLTVSDDRAVGGMLQPNQLVDVLMTATINVPQSVLDEGRYYTDKATKVTYQNMVILARVGSFYIMKAPLAIAEEITHLQASGNAQFSMVLRPDADVRVADASRLGATTNVLIQRYGLPIPEVYPPGGGPLPTRPPEPTPAPSLPAASPEPNPSVAP